MDTLCRDMIPSSEPLSYRLQLLSLSKSPALTTLSLPLSKSPALTTLMVARPLDYIMVGKRACHEFSSTSSVNRQLMSSVNEYRFHFYIFTVITICIYVHIYILSYAFIRKTVSTHSAFIIMFSIHVMIRRTWDFYHIKCFYT